MSKLVLPLHQNFSVEFYFFKKIESILVPLFWSHKWFVWPCLACWKHECMFPTRGHAAPCHPHRGRPRHSLSPDHSHRLIVAASPRRRHRLGLAAQIASPCPLAALCLAPRLPSRGFTYIGLLASMCHVASSVWAYLLPRGVPTFFNDFFKKNSRNFNHKQSVPPILVTIHHRFVTEIW